jgi:ketosteroid isomerase-like protein
MRPAVLAAIASLIGAPAAAAQQESAEQEILRLERELAAAGQRKDPVPARRLFAEDLTGVTSRGTQFNKGRGLAIIEGSAITGFVLDSLRARVYGDAAVATGRVTFSGAIEGVQYPDRQVLFTDTWTRKNGRWQLVSIHLTSVDRNQK